MANLNKVFLMGHLTRDPELRTTSGGTAVVDFGLATNRYRKDQPDEVTFIDCTAWAGTGEAIANHLSKGSPIHIEGRLTFNQWDDRETGKKRSKLSVTVERFNFIGRQSAPQTAEPTRPPQSDTVQVDDDLPF